MSIFNNFGVDFSKLRVLLVEDSEFALNLEKQALRELGFQAVVVARDGQEAYDTLEQFETINLIVSDWNMPNLDGLELLKAARRNWPGIPFVLLTINDSVEHLAEARKNGVDAYVIKPFSLDILRDKIISAIRRRLALGGAYRLGQASQHAQALLGGKVSGGLEDVLVFATDENDAGARSELG